MKKYKLLREVIGAEVGTIFKVTEDQHGIDLVEGKSLGAMRCIGLNNEEWFEKIEKLPNFKVGDYVVLEDNVGFIYKKIENIYFDKDFNDFCTGGNKHSLFRKPTEEELNKYFR